MKKYRGVRYNITKIGNKYFVKYYWAGKEFTKSSYFKSKAKALAFSDIDWTKDENK